MQGYKVFSRDIRYMEAQDPLWRGGGRGWLDRYLFGMELDVSCRFGFRPGGEGFEIGKVEGWPSFYVSPWGGWMRPPPPLPFLSFVLGSVAELRTVLRNAVCESTLGA